MNDNDVSRNIGMCGEYNLSLLSKKIEIGSGYILSNGRVYTLQINCEDERYLIFIFSSDVTQQKEESRSFLYRNFYKNILLIDFNFCCDSPEGGGGVTRINFYDKYFESILSNWLELI